MVAAAPMPWNPRKMSSVISSAMRQGYIDITTKTERRWRTIGKSKSERKRREHERPGDKDALAAVQVRYAAKEDEKATGAE